MTPDIASSKLRDDSIVSIAMRLACKETWSGNERAANLVELPGLSAFVHSVPFGPGEAGGRFTICQCVLIAFSPGSRSPM